MLLAEAGVTGIDPALVDVRGEGPEAEADWATLETRETYLGYAPDDRVRLAGAWPSTSATRTRPRRPWT